MERKTDIFSKTQETLIQAMHRIKRNQESPQVNLISERPKRTLPSQPLHNPKNFMQINKT